MTSARITQGGLSFARLHEESYLFVAATELLQTHPLRQPGDAAAHTLLELDPSLPLFRYFLDACPPEQTWAFAKTQFLGTIGPIRTRCLEGAGVAVLPAYYVKQDIKAKRLTPLLPKVKMGSDWFRLVWRQGHPQTVAIQSLARELANLPLR